VLTTSHFLILRACLWAQLGEEVVPRQEANWFSLGRWNLNPAIWVMPTSVLDYPSNGLRMPCALL
jgi:hypothetical protein